jgi:hypothetical protein
MTRITLRLALAGMLVAPLPAMSDVIYDQGQPALTSGAFFVDFLAADDFVAGFDAQVHSVTFWTFQSTDAQLDESFIRYAFWTDLASGSTDPNEDRKPAATSFASGLAQNVLREETGGTSGSGLTQVRYTFDLQSVVGIDGGERLWLSLAVSNLGAGSLLWNFNTIDVGQYARLGAEGEPVSWFAPSALGIQDSVSFQLHGEAAPIPATLFLTLGGLAALRGVRALTRRGRCGDIGGSAGCRQT